MKWWLTQDAFSGRAIWRGEEPPQWNRLQSCWHSPQGHWAAERAAGLWLINALWPHVGAPGLGELVEISAPVRLIPLHPPLKGETL